MTTIKTTIVCAGLMLLSSANVTATELVYKPINPAFGGNPLNANMLLSKAQSQNKHRAPIIEKTYDEKFQESLERTYLNRLVREITDVAFGDDIKDSIFDQDATFMSGDYQIQVITSTSDTITVRITNTASGEETILEVPRFASSAGGGY
ncbi:MULTISPECIES: curli assembly protein CsgF [Pseudoalteromonas]|uniref:curli assembly protein CsgF n=1 Tax=Pseudoalteromonas TaxID=53246 RepID=UPI001981B5FF|nr:MULTISPECIES: curli assembly protein CsgF [Pseudoalteromonas]MCG7538890.1 curli assembly protein CsgF [Pseudoalteromonas sp. OF7H-1]MCG9770578.1 curli assembly protein CsgF [Pseudoalteromonas piscicida]